MAWEHKGITINLDGASFVGTVHGKRFCSSSLAAAKKAIDKQLEAKASEVPLTLNLLRVNSGKYEHCVLVGLDTESLKAKFADGKEVTSFVRGNYYPDDEESVRVNREFEAAEKAFEAARRARNVRNVNLHFNTSSRPYTTYGQAIETLLKRYADAKASQVKD